MSMKKQWKNIGKDKWEDRHMQDQILVFPPPALIRSSFLLFWPPGNRWDGQTTLSEGTASAHHLPPPRKITTEGAPRWTPPRKQLRCRLQTTPLAQSGVLHTPSCAGHRMELLPSNIIPMNWFTKQRETHRVIEGAYGSQGERMGEGTVGESGMGMDARLGFTWRTSKDLLSSPGKSAQYSAINFWSPGGRMGEGTVRESGMDVDARLCFTWRTSKDLLGSPGKSAQRHGAAGMEGEFMGENGYVSTYAWVPWLSAWNYHSVFNQLYPNTK